MDGPDEPWNFQGSTNRYYGTLTHIRQDAYIQLEKTYVDILRAIMPRFYTKYPGNKLVIGDCSALRGDHSYHNKKTFDIFDINYFTFGKNLTHYRMNNELPLEELWLDNFPYRQLDLSVFDAARNAAFFKMIHEVFPKSSIATSCGISLYLQKVYGLGFMWHGDDNHAWHHWMHSHIQLGNDVNWDYIL